MSDTPKFEVIDRRRMKKEEEQEGDPSQPSAAPSPEPEHESSGPRRVETESAKPPQSESALEAPEEETLPGEMPPPPSAEEMRTAPRMAWPLSDLASRDSEAAALPLSLTVEPAGATA